MTNGVPHITQEQVLLAKEIKSKSAELYRLEHLEHAKVIQQTYYKDNTLKCRTQGREWNARNSALKMKGLCHICFCSNIEIFNHKGQIICDSCVQDQIRDA